MSVSVIIVDDEPMVIESIKWGIEWESLDASLVGTFTDSISALEFIKNNPIQIVITDIDMPPFNGLVLCSRILNINPNIQLIIISGYADFSYAQKSIHYGAIGYCLKPIDYDELSLYIKKAISRISPEQATSISQDFIELIYENNIALLSTFLQKQGLSWPYYIASSISSQPVFSSFSRRFGLNEYIYLSSTPYVVSKEHNNSVFKGVYLHPQPVCIEDLSEAIIQSLYYPYQYFFAPQNTIFTQPAIYYDKLLVQAKSLFPHPEELKKLLHSSNVNHISWATDLYNSALRYVGQEPTYSHHHLLYQFTNFDDLTDKICLLLHSKTDIEWDVSCTNRNFLKLIKYIQENFTTDISSQTLAEELSLNACYIGQLLKKETGTTLPQYLNELRINYAKELLITTEMGINEIGETCGYQDYFYFIKKFKKNTGKTPSAFRQESKI
ncbi:MAG: response regulator [Lachnospiraceae bacterium]|nr:response regulator [Lachnospiraceae bacterium]